MSDLIPLDRRKEYAITGWYAPRHALEEWDIDCFNRNVPRVTWHGISCGKQLGAAAHFSHLLDKAPLELTRLIREWHSFHFLTTEAGAHSDHSVFAELDEVFADAQGENWDGEGAAPVTQEAYQTAQEFLRRLPPDLPAPEIAAEPDGHLALEWYRGPGYTFSVSVGPTGTLTYAGLFGKVRAYGTEYLNEAIPGIIVENIRRLFREED